MGPVTYPGDPPEVEEDDAEDDDDQDDEDQSRVTWRQSADQQAELQSCESNKLISFIS